MGCWYLQLVICLCVLKELLVPSNSYISLGSEETACFFNQLYISEFLRGSWYLQSVICLCVCKELLVSSDVSEFLRSCLYLQSVISLSVLKELLLSSIS